MGDYVKAGKISEFSDGTKKKVTIQDREILLARVGGSYYAINNRCPHLGGDLSAGKLEGNVITCPRHGSQFDVTNGWYVRFLNGSGLASVAGMLVKSLKPVKVYKVKVENDDIMIEI
jgi:3-phenylpropionate/trans-cinnamate dioxygenase ferredoxin component